MTALPMIGPYLAHLPASTCLERAGSFEVAARAGVGKIRSADAAAGGPGRAIVADGVGRRPGSPRAAEIAVTAAHWSLQAAEQVDEATLRGAVHAAQSAIDDAGIRILGDGATTLTIAAVLTDGAGRRRLGVAWVGDSPCALVHHDAWTWVTTPDTEPIDAPGRVGDLPVLGSSRLRQALGAGRTIDVHVRTIVLPPRAAIIVASDGLLDGGRDAGTLLTSTRPLSAAALVEAVIAHGARDDVTVAVIHPDGSAAKPPRRSDAPPRRRRRWRR